MSTDEAMLKRAERFLIAAFAAQEVADAVREERARIANDLSALASSDGGHIERELAGYIDKLRKACATTTD